MKIAVTGATGFLGRHIANLLVEKGHHVVACVRSPARAENERYEARACDLRDLASLQRAFRGADVVVANAALGSKSGSLDELRRTNVRGSEDVARAASDAEVQRLVYISTTAVYRAAPWQPLAEDAPLRCEPPRWSDPTRWTTDARYSWTKTLAEEVTRARCAEAQLPCVVLRPGPLYGSGDTRFTKRLIGWARRPVSVVPTLQLPMLHASDVAACVHAACLTDDALGRAFNLAGPPESLYRMACELRKRLGAPGVTIPLPVPLRASYNTSAAVSFLGLSPRGLGHGLDEVAASLHARS